MPKGVKSRHRSSRSWDRLRSGKRRSQQRSRGTDEFAVRRLRLQRKSKTPPRALKERKSTNRRQERESQVSLFSDAILGGIDKIINHPQKLQSCNIHVKDNIICEFNPLNHDINDWLPFVDEYAQINNWSDNVTCYLALGKLRGPAETWCRGLPTRLFTWTEWKDLLLRNFQPKRDLYKLMSSMIKLEATSQQGLYEYCFEKLALINRMKLNLTDSDKVNLIMGGIHNEQIKFSVDTANITCPATLARHLKVFQERSRNVAQLGVKEISAV
ncbi:hypothetical protein ABEB36_000085 [Hypothenemus hampei]|uniref:Retrotransposon gag domain-containing protein n=1 Tax=Hypothenemus hampei TaxID=57062 RepID=A0ABD1FA60_HYPHA